MYDGFLLSRNLAGEWENHLKRLAELSSHLREARDLNATLESEVLRLQGEVGEERKKIETVMSEMEAAIKRSERALKRHEDLRAATEVREDALNKVISDLEGKVKSLSENELKLSSTVSALRKDEGVD